VTSAKAHQAVDSYDFTAIDFPGARDTQPLGVNNAGDVVGRYDYDGVTYHAFLLRDGNFATIDVPYAAATQARVINDQGQIVGVWVDSVGAEHGYLLDGGTFIPIEFPGAANTAALGLNDRGDVVGRFNLGDPNTAIGFLLRGGQFTSFEVPSSLPQSTVAEAINGRGQIVGWSTDVTNSVVNGFMLDRGLFRSIDFPGAEATLPFGVNEKEQTSGSCFCVEGQSHGFVLSSGKFVIVDFPVVNSRTGVWKINDRGQIVGSYQQGPPGGPNHGFIATPQNND
jgi:probable HAF family extracellular repeat protein